MEDPAKYDAWYSQKRGAWIGKTEYTLIRRNLPINLDDSVLDVGCGTGYFTRRFAQDQRGPVVGLDPDYEAINYARQKGVKGEKYIVGSGEKLPFSDASFDYVVAITSLCFVQKEGEVIAEMVRVARKGCAIGLLNRRSLLWYKKRRAKSYKKAHWHRPKEALALCYGSKMTNFHLSSALFFPNYNSLSKVLESVIPQQLLLGGFLLITAEVCHSAI